MASFPSNPSSTSRNPNPPLPRKRKSRKGANNSVDEIIGKWRKIDGDKDVAGGKKVEGKAASKVQAKGSKKGCMKGKGGPENSECKYRGVRQRVNGRWVSEIRAPNGGPRYWLGTFQNSLDAALAYDKAARDMYGSNARVNFPCSVNSQADPPTAVSETSTTASGSGFCSGGGDRIRVCNSESVSDHNVGAREVYVSSEARDDVPGYVISPSPDYEKSTASGSGDQIRVCDSESDSDNDDDDGYLFDINDYLPPEEQVLDHTDDDHSVAVPVVVAVPQEMFDLDELFDFGRFQNVEDNINSYGEYGSSLVGCEWQWNNNGVPLLFEQQQQQYDQDYFCMGY